MAETNNNLVFVASALVAILVPTSSYIYMQGQNNQISKQLVDVSRTLNTSVKELSVEMNLLNSRVKTESVRADFNEKRIAQLEQDVRGVNKELGYLTGSKMPR